MVPDVPLPPDRGPTERRILDHAETAFLGTPKEVVRVTDIAAAAGVSVGTVYLHFGSKAGLYAAVREDIQLELTEFTMEPVTRDEPVAWRHVIENSLKWEQAFCADLARVRLMAALDFTAGADAHAIAINERIGARVRAALATAADRLGEGVEHGIIRRCCEPLPTAIWIYGTITGTAISLLQLPAEAVTTEVARDAFARQRRMLAQALLPIALLDDDGAAPEAYWANPALPR